jgi:hypothetical protein
MKSRLSVIAACLFILAAAPVEAGGKCSHHGYCPQPPAPAGPTWQDTWRNSNWELGLPLGAALGMVGDQATHKLGWAPIPRRAAVMGVCALAAHVSELEDKNDVGNGYSKKGVLAGIIGCGLGVYASHNILVWQERNGPTVVAWRTEF